jgi:hypothetical protein
VTSTTIGTTASEDPTVLSTVVLPVPPIRNEEKIMETHAAAGPREVVSHRYEFAIKLDRPWGADYNQVMEKLAEAEAHYRAKVKLEASRQVPAGVIRITPNTATAEIVVHYTVEEPVR